MEFFLGFISGIGSVIATILFVFALALIIIADDDKKH